MRNHETGAEEKEVFSFTVAQLIEVLQTLPQDLPVLVSGYESGYENFYHPELAELKHVPENMYYDGEFQTAEKGDTDTFEAVVLRRVVRAD
ncbi:MAG: hypothetical protein HQK65_13490 [Desulfamplus sp.]|nr:hypothetical protein [Desulfamplus sp.]